MIGFFPHRGHLVIRITNLQFTIYNEFSMIQCLKIEKLIYSMKIEN